MKSSLPILALFTVFFAACQKKEEAHPEPDPGGEATSAGGSAIETLWVADQFTGMMGSWMRNQQRYLITDTTVIYQGLDLKQQDWIQVELSSGESRIVSHRKNDHGGVIELAPGPGEFLTVSEELFGEDGAPPQMDREYEKFEAEEGMANSLLAYRWLEGGRIDIVELWEEEGPEAKPLDAEAVLASLEDADAFSTYRWVDEESLLPNDPVFVSVAELRELGETLQEFTDGDEAAFERISNALDERWKGEANGAAPGHLGEIGLFTDAYRFGSIFREAMIDAGYNPYTGAFAFARFKVGSQLEDDDEETLALIETLFRRQAGHFEGAVRQIVEESGSTVKLPELMTDEDRVSAQAPVEAP